MNTISKSFAALCLAASLAGGLSGNATAQEFPTKPIRIIVPYAAGGATDIIARQISVGLTERLGQPIIIETRPGGGGGIGTTFVAKAAPDGYTLLFGNVAPNAIFPAMYANLAYDPEKDFAPIGLVVITPLILVVRPQTPVRNVRELIAYGKANEGKVFYGTTGVGATSHVASELFNLMAGTKFIHVPYKGSAPASIGAISGETTMYFGTGPEITNHIKAGTLRAIAISTSTRAPASPDLPTVAESGLPGFSVDVWFGLLAPGGTPRPIVDKINRALGLVVNSPEQRKRFIDSNSVPAFNSPDEFAAMIKSDIAKWGKVVRDAGIKAE